MTTLVAEIAENFYRLMALDKRLENLDQIIELQERSLEIAKARKEAARSTELGVLRFQAEVQRNQSEKLIINQEIIEGENRINFLVNRYPQRVERDSAGFYDLNIHPLSVGVPSQLLQNRPDIRQAERELAAAGLDVKVARVNFFPQLVITGGVGLQSFILNHLFEPDAVIGDIAGGLVGPLINKRAIRAQYLTANARQLQSDLQLPARHPQRLHRGYQPHDHGGELQQEHRDQEAAVENARGRSRIRQRSFSECPHRIHRRAIRPA